MGQETKISHKIVDPTFFKMISGNVKVKDVTKLSYPWRSQTWKLEEVGKCEKLKLLD